MVSLLEIEESITHLSSQELLQFRSWYKAYDSEFEDGIEKQWVEESEKRHEAYQRGEVQAVSLQEIRKRYES